MALHHWRYVIPTAFQGLQLLYLQEFDRLDVDLVKRLGNEFHLLEIDGLEVDASDAAVPCSPVVESEGMLVCCGCYLGR